MSEPDEIISELELENQSQVRLKSIPDLELVCKESPEFISKIIDALVNNCLKTEKPVELDAVHKIFIAMFHLNREVSLTAMLKNLVDLKVKVFPKTGPPKVKDVMDSYIYPLTKRRIFDLIEKSLEKESQKDLQELTQILEENAGLDAFYVSNEDGVNKFISCLQMAVPFFARGAPTSKFLEFMIRHDILPDFDKLPEQMKVDFIRAFAEISAHATTQVAQQMLPLIIELLKKFIDHKKMDELMSVTYVECLLYVLHHLAHKARDAATLLFNQEFIFRLKSVRSMTRRRMEKLVEILSEDDKQVRESENYDKAIDHMMQLKFKNETDRQRTKTEIRSCTNIRAFIELFKKRKACSIRDNSVKLSWKETRKALLIPRTNRVSTYSIAPDRSAALKSLPYDCIQSLYDVGICYPDKNQVSSLVDFDLEQVSGNRDGNYVLNDNGNIAMLCWPIRQADLGLVKNIGEKGRTGKVRNQLYHLLCWTYAASDLVSCRRSKSCHPLCPWYLCAFCSPLALGNDEKVKEPKEDNRIHHCYSDTIESALLHIKENGIPRERVSEFNCTDYQPPTADEPWMEKRKNIKIRRISTLEDALKELENQPVGADLLHYTRLMKYGPYIYYGPKSPETDFRAYHAVVIEAVRQIDNEWVAVCKMSNGEFAGADGYAYVSLATQYMPIGVSGDKKKFIRSTGQPMHLLTDFFVVEMDANENEKEDEENNDEESEDEESEDEGNEDEKEDAKEDEKPLDEKPEEEPEEKKYTSKPKRGRLASGRKRWTSDLLDNNVGMLGVEDPITVTESDAVNVIENAITRHNSERIKDIIVKQKGSLLLEMQQRAIEYNSIVDRHKNIRSSLVERMSVLDEATFNVRRAESFLASASTVAKPSISLPNGVEKRAVSPLVDLLDLDSDDFLQDLLSVDLGSAQFATNGPAYPPIVAYESSSLKIEFTFSKPPGNPQRTNVQATFINLSPNTFTEFIFHAAVPKFLQLHLDPASSETLLAIINGLITQNLRVTNSQHGKVWCIGEYGDLLVNKVPMLSFEDPITITESDVVDVFKDAITSHNTDSTAKAMALVALLKLSSHFLSISDGRRINDIIVKQKGSLHVEMQQRAIEFDSIVERHKIIRSSLVEIMPVLDEASFNVRKASSLPASVSTMSKHCCSSP